MPGDTHDHFAAGPGFRLAHRNKEHVHIDTEIRANSVPVKDILISMATLEQRVVDWITKETGTPPDRVSLASRLPDDFDMDQIETAELLDKFGDQFQVDLAALRDHCELYFHPIGVSVAYPFWIPVVIAATVYGLFPAVVARIPRWAGAILVLAVIWWGCRRFHAMHIAERISINVQDLVDAAIAGKRTKLPR